MYLDGRRKDSEVNGIMSRKVSGRCNVQSTYMVADDCHQSLACLGCIWTGLYGI